MHFNFWKWEGTGNDFILFDQREWPEVPNAEDIAAWCDREQGLGADGVIFFQPCTDVDASGKCDSWEMDYLNADGSRSFCGNGSRALFAFLRAQGWMKPEGGVLHACDGAHAVKWHPELEVPAVQLMNVNPPIKAPNWASSSGLADFVDTGSPHHIEWIEPSELAAFDVSSRGQSIRNQAHYAPDGVNVDFVSCSGPAAMQMRTFERGVEDETKACGTGAAAAAIADFNRRGGAHFRKVTMAGGELIIEFQSEQKPDSPYREVWLAGAAKQLSKGVTDGAKWLMMAVLLFCSFGASNLASAVNSAASSSWSDDVQVSILTGSPGPELYSAWGHTAIRITDWGQTPPVDWTYNYGTFQFSEGFYARFMRGQLDYRLAKAPFAAFQREYLTANRAILEQVLEIGADDARALIAFLEWNHLPENRVYSYKFLHDNCSTRALSALQNAWGERFEPHCEKDEARLREVTYRKALEPYIQGDAWIEAGIDFILGPRVDRAMPACGSSFLPDGLMAQMMHVTLDGQPVAGPPVELLPPQRPWFRSVHVPFMKHPVFWAFVVLIWSGGWSIRRLIQLRNDVPTSRKERWAGKAVQSLAGLLGVLLLLMWTITDHQDTWANWNLIWASPFLALLAGLRRFKSHWADRLQFILALSILLFLIAGAFVPQFVSLVSACLAWSVWLTLDPWKWPWGRARKTVYERMQKR